METTQPAALTANVGQTRTVDLDAAFDGGTGAYTYTVTGNDANVATSTVTGNNMEVTAVGAGSTSFTVKATDELGDSRTVTVNITVNAALASTALPDTTVNKGATVELTLSNYFTPGTGTLTYTITTSDAAVATASSSAGVLTVTAVGNGTADITVSAKDETGATTSQTMKVTVNATFAATGSISDKSLQDGDQLNQDADSVTVSDVTTLFTGGTAPYSYSVSENSADSTVSASLDASNNLLVVATGSGVNSETATVTVTATDSFGEEATVTFDVTTTPAFGDVNANGLVNSSDASSILQAAIEAITFTATQETAADVNQDNYINSFDASVTFRYFLEVAGYTALPYSATAKASNADLAYGEATIENGVVTIPVMIEGNEIVALDFIGDYNANEATLQDLTINGLPDDWMVVKSTDEEGKVKFALAGMTPISSTEIATITFKLNDGNSAVGLLASGSINNIEYSKDELSVKEVPQSFALEQNYPNPFNPTTNVRYQLPASADVTIELFNINGQKVSTLVSKRQNAGTYTLTVDGNNLASGIYMYRITAKADDATFTSIKKMTLIK
jgi:hypothetical protein